MLTVLYAKVELFHHIIIISLFLYSRVISGDEAGGT